MRTFYCDIDAPDRAIFIVSAKSMQDAGRQILEALKVAEEKGFLEVGGMFEGQVARFKEGEYEIVEVAPGAPALRQFS